MKINALLIILLLAIPFSAFSQKYKYEGKVTDQENTPLSYAVITVVHSSDSSIIKNLLSDNEGLFSYEYDSTSLPINLIFTFSGKAKHIETITSAKNVNEKTIVLNSKDTELDEVEIKAKQPQFSVEHDKVIYHIAGTPAEHFGFGTDALRMAPGVIMDSNRGNIKLNGLPVTVFVNDREVILQGEDLIQYLNSFFTEDINNIEIISNPSAKYRGDISGSIINIKTNPTKESRLVGRSHYGLEIGDKMRNTAGVSLGTRKGGWDIYASGDIRVGENYNNTTIDRQQDSEVVRHQNDIAIDYKTFNYRGGIEHRNEKGSMGIIAYGNIDDSPNFSNGVITGNDVKLISTVNDVQQSNQTHLFNAYKDFYWKNGSKLKLNADYITYYGENNQKANATQELDNIDDYAPFEQTSNSNSSNFSGQADFETALFKLPFNMGLKYTQTEQIGNLNTTVPVTEQSQYNYEEKTYAGYIESNFKVKDWSFNTGIRSELFKINGQQFDQQIVDTTYLNLLPSAGISLNKELGVLSLNYRSSVTRPSFWELNPFEYYVDPFIKVAGNPFLLPGVDHSLTLSYRLFHHFEFGLRGMTSVGRVEQFVAQNQNGTLLMSRENFDQYDQYAFYTNLPLGGDYFMLNIGYSYGYNFIKSELPYLNDQDELVIKNYESSTDVHLLNLSLETFFNEKFNILANYTYFTGNQTGLYKNGRRSKLEAGVRFHLLKEKALRLELKYIDIFRNDFEQASLSFEDINMDLLSRYDSRYFSFKISYLFSNKKLFDFKTRDLESSQEIIDRTGQ